MSIEVLEVLKKTFADPGRQVKEWKQDTGGKAIGFLLTEVPEELIHAAGFFPFGICGGRARLEQAEAHLQSWACSYVRKGLALAINGELDFLDGILSRSRVILPVCFPVSGNTTSRFPIWIATACQNKSSARALKNTFLRNWRE